MWPWSNWIERPAGEVDGSIAPDAIPAESTSRRRTPACRRCRLVPCVVARQVFHVQVDAQADGDVPDRIEHSVEVRPDRHGQLNGDLEAPTTINAWQVGDRAQTRNVDSGFADRRGDLVDDTRSVISGEPQGAPRRRRAQRRVPRPAEPSPRFQLPSWKRTTSASDATTPARSRPMMVNRVRSCRHSCTQPRFATRRAFLGGEAVDANPTPSTSNYSREPLTSILINVHRIGRPSHCRSG